MSLPYNSKQRQDTAIRVKQLQSEEHLCQRKLQLLRKRLTDLEQLTPQPGSSLVNATNTQQPYSVVGSTGRPPLNEPIVGAGAGLLSAQQQQMQQQQQKMVGVQGGTAVGVQGGVLPPQKRTFGGNSNVGNPVPIKSESGLQSSQLEVGAKDKEKDREKRLQIPWQMCSTILKNLLKHKDVGPFSKPVDPIEAGAPDYYNVVSKPMDLGTVAEKLKSPRQYTTPLQFRDDVRQVWKNCRLYNPPGTWIRVTGEKLSEQFEKNWVQKQVEERWFQETGQVDSAQISQKMMEMGKEYRHKMDNMRKAANKSGRKEATEFEERRKLSQQITQLPGEKLIQVLDLIIDLESEYNFDGEAEVELDISELKVTTIEQLKNLLKRLTNGRNMQKSNTFNNNNIGTQNGDIIGGGQPAPRHPSMSNPAPVQQQQQSQQREQLQKQAAERSLKQFQQQQVQQNNMRRDVPQNRLEQQQQQQQIYSNNNNNNLYNKANGKQEENEEIFYDQNGRSNFDETDIEAENNKNQKTTTIKEEKDVKQIVDQLIDNSVQQQNHTDDIQQTIQQQQNSDNNTNSSNKRHASIQNIDEQQQYQQHNINNNNNNNIQQQLQQNSNKRQKNTPSEEDDETEDDSNEQENRSHGTEEDMWEDFKSRDERIREQQQLSGEGQQQQQQQFQQQQQQLQNQQQISQQQQQMQFIPQYDVGVEGGTEGDQIPQPMEVDQDQAMDSEDPEDI